MKAKTKLKKVINYSIDFMPILIMGVAFLSHLIKGEIEWMKEKHRKKKNDKRR